MKKNFSLLQKPGITVIVLISVFIFRSNAQFTEISAVGGYTLGETFYTSDGYEVYLHDGATFGGSIAFYPSEHYDVAISYTRQETKANIYDYYFNHYTDDVKASVNNIMLHFDRNQVLNANGTSVFGGLGLGTCGLEPKQDQDAGAGNSYSGRWKFGFDIHAGAKIMASEKVGIRLQTGINFPVQYFGAAFTVGTGGAGAGVGASGTITQVYFLGGLIFRIHKT